MNKSAHIIEKVVVDVNTGNPELANSIKDKIGGFLETELFPQLEKLLDEYDQSGRVVRFNSLNLNIAAPRSDNFNGIESEISRQLARKFKSTIGIPGGETALEIEKKAVESIPTEKNRENTFLFFLENGYLPWFGKEAYIAETTAPLNWHKSLENSRFFARLKNVLQKNNGAINRFTLQFDDKTVLPFLLKSNPGFSDLEKDAVKIARNLAPVPRSLFLQFLVSGFVGNPSEDLMQIAVNLFTEIHKTSVKIGDVKSHPVLPEMKELIRKLQELPQKTTPVLKANLAEIQNLFHSDDQELEKTKRLIVEKSQATKDRINGENWNAKKNQQKKDKEEQHPFFEDKTGEIAVKNAGIILVHPFLKQFFKTIEVTDKDGKLMEDRRYIAVHALHFLATGEEEFFEGNLVFYKFLCGLPLKMPVPRTSLLTNFMKEEASHLLTETIKHWPALKSTSPDGLRQMFLQRDGKLISKEQNFKLIVERKTQDILLDKLAWNISLVKLPWSNELLYIEW